MALISPEYSSPLTAVADARVLVVDDDEMLLAVLAGALSSAGFAVDTAATAEQALRRFTAAIPDVCIVDVAMPGLDGFAFLERARMISPETPILMLSGFGGLDDAVRASEAGAANYLVKPIGADALVFAVREALGAAADHVALHRPMVSGEAEAAFQRLVGNAPRMHELRTLISDIAPTRCAVLVQGETGTGKELVARALHALSGRRGEFVALNCAAIPDGLVESTLFGHERGAFTGAQRREIGVFEQSNGGTLLLDEVTEMRADLQTKLLRVLQESEVNRVGGRDTVRLDFRIIATTNRDPEEAVRTGVLREDLLYRLDVVRVRVPALRERPGDIPVLASAILARAAQEFDRPMPSVSTDALRAMQEYLWPGNVRQLQHVLQRALLISRGPTITERDLMLTPPRVMTPGAAALAHPEPEQPVEPALPLRAVPDPVPAPSAAVAAQVASSTPAELPTLNVGSLERMAIARALAIAGGNRTRAAELLGFHVRTLHRKIAAPAEAEQSDGTHRDAASA